MLLPSDWPFVVRGVVESVLGSWLVVVVPAIAVYVSTSAMDAAAALSVGSALRVGTGLWSLGLGGSYGSPSSSAGELGLPMLGVTAIQWLIVRAGVARTRPVGPLSGVLFTLLSVVATGIVLAASSPAQSRTWPALIGMLFLSGVVVTSWLLRHRGTGVLGDAWKRRPIWVSPALLMARDMTVVLLAFSITAVGFAGFNGAERMTRLHDTLANGGVVATCGLILIELAWLPTVVVWAMSWLAGPGFVVGQGTSFAPDHVVAGAVPTLPLLGLLPTAPLGGEGARWGIFLPLLFTIAAMLVAWRLRRHTSTMRLAHAIVAAVGASIILTLGVLLACLAASGPIGPGRLNTSGPDTLLTTILIAVEVGVGLVAGVTLVHPTTRRATERGVHNAAQATQAAAHNVKDGVTQAVGRRGDKSHGDKSHSQGDNMASEVSMAQDEPCRVVVLVSGTGSNLKALLDACHDPSYGARIVGVVADKDCQGLSYAQAEQVPCRVISPRTYSSRTDWDQALTDAVAQMEPELIVCAGFMRILGKPFLDRFEGSVINTHPSLLPDFPGAHAVRDALAAGARRAGATLFWVDAGVDTGAHIAQVEVPVEAGDTEETLTARVKAAETPQLVEQVGLIARDLVASR